MNIKTASYQELFNTMWNGMESQGWKLSIDEADACLYRGENGLKCPIGHCIDDETAGRWEGASLRTAITWYDFKIEPDRLEFLTRCQRAHDSLIRVPESMKNEFRNIAKKYNLTIPGE